MPGREKSGEARTRAVVYCVVPSELADKLHEPLRRHFRDDAATEVIVEQRGRERRSAAERRRAEEAAADERRRIRAEAGRRVADRRAALVPVAAPELPRRLSAHAAHLVFFERIEPSSEALEDRDTARLVARFQTGDQDAFATLYNRYFDRVYSYLLVVLGNQHQAEDATQHVFMRVFESLPRYERRRQPFRAWLFTIVRNYALDQLKASRRLEVLEPEIIETARDDEPAHLPVLDWITDRELGVFIQRLPLAQRQVLVLRFMLDLPYAEIAAILDRSQADVRMLQSRALAFLRQRLRAVGQGREGARRVPMRRRGRRVDVLRARRWALVP
jgi:RNA polymerase sigma-70 factor (ECF subfamily)